MRLEDIWSGKEYFPRYKLSKTLRFELRPVGRTQQTFREQFLEHDEKRAEAYPLIKKLLDEEHKQLLERALDGANCADMKWDELAEAHDAFRNGARDAADRKALSDVQARYRKEIAAKFKSDSMFALLTSPTPEKVFKEWAARNSGELAKRPEVEAFKGFACYFTGYQENRKNIYSEEAQATSAANRAVNENFPKFLEAARTVSHICEAYPGILEDAGKELGEFIAELQEEYGCGELGEYFCVERYGRYLSQKGIETFNQLVGGYAKEDGTKVRGLNEFINLHRQQNEEAREDRKLHPLKPLYKQILSDRETKSFVPRALANDKEAAEAIAAFFAECIYGGAAGGEKGSLPERILALLKTVTLREGLWARGDQIAAASTKLYGEWNRLNRAMESHAEKLASGESTEKKRKAAAEKWLKREEYELSELAGLAEQTDDGEKSIDVTELWRGEIPRAAVSRLEKAHGELKPVLDGAEKKEFRLRGDAGAVAKVKEALDAAMELLHLLKPLAVGEEVKRDETFYGEFDEIYSMLANAVPLYSKVRNHLTKKPGNETRIKLMFDNPTLANGWDKNKEKDNLCVLLFKDGLHYLGIMSKKAKTDFSKLATAESGGTYRKMVYKLLPGPEKMLPKVFFSEKGKKEYSPDEELVKGREAKLHQTDIGFCHRLIDFYKGAIAKHPDWGVFGFRFKPTGEYRDLNEFYEEVRQQGYKLTFENIPEEAIDRLVQSGKLCLFQVRNKDFSEHSTGRPNLHTMYWKALFSPENLADVALKLDGEAELFHRKASIKEPFRHRTGEKLVNRRTKDGKPIPEDLHGELFRFVNGKQTALSAAARELLESGAATVKDVKHEITKDRRYAEDRFAFHVPMSFNFKSGKCVRFNDSVLEYLSGNPDVNVIGIDRGERHLLYLTLINRKGEILLQKTLNEVAHNASGGAAATDYHAKLDNAEKERDRARKSWTEIGAIKDLKEGYLSAVVHEIAKLMVEHNAIVALEDLNFGFKRGRFRIEKQVYQKFEQALIKKLNYLVFKDRSAGEPGGVLNAYQLTAPFESFEKLGKQTGFIFYVPAGYTSKIDPTTGFTNLFNLKKCTNFGGIREFFGKFESIKYDGKRGAWAFAFDYSKFKTGQEPARKEWVAYSAERRLAWDKEAREEKEISPTGMITAALEKRGKTVRDGFDLKAELLGLEPGRDSAAFAGEVFRAFERTLQMRNSRARTGEDYIESPVENARGERYDSRKAHGTLPENADANGAYHIALKGLFLLEKRIDAGDGKLKIEHKDWFAYVQGRNR